MANFNTNQTRHLYVAKAIDDTHAIDTADFEEGSIALKTVLDEEGGNPVKFFFAYKNADGLATRSDLIDVKCVSHLKASLTTGGVNPMDIPLIAHTIALDTDVVDVTSATMIGKTLSLMVTVHQALSYDDNDSITFAAPVTITSAINTPALFHQALAKAIIQHTPGQLKGSFKVFTASGVEITKDNMKTQAGEADGIVLVPCSQSYIRGTLSNEPVNLSVAFAFRVSNVEDVQWGTDTVAASSIDGCKTIPAVYALADLEYFSLGERGEYGRGNAWYNREPKYAISDADIEEGVNYDVLNIEFFWAGNAEHVQKSPRLIQIAATSESGVVSDLYDAVKALIEG